MMILMVLTSPDKLGDTGRPHLVPENVGLRSSKDKPIRRGLSQTHSPPAVLRKAWEDMPAR
jgi:hypothetical protein